MILEAGESKCMAAVLARTSLLWYNRMEGITEQSSSGLGFSSNTTCSGRAFPPP